MDVRTPSRRPATPRLAPAFAGLALLWALAPAAPAQALFTDVSGISGFSGTPMQTNNGHALGVTWLDFDDDGWEDLFLVNGKGYVKELYRNLANGTFELRLDLLPALPDVEMMGAVAGDYDNDGDVDLYAFTDHEMEGLDVGPLDGPLNLLLQNLFVENGRTFSTPLFVEIATAAGVDDEAIPPLGTDYPGHRSAIGGFLDADRDGWLDLYVGHWAMPAPQGHRANQDRLFRNAGDGTFADVSDEWGLPSTTDRPKLLRATLGFVGAHLDSDLWPDLYVGHSGTNPNEAGDLVYFNDGTGAFVESTGDSPGVGDDATANMGVTVSDVERDGDFDLYMSDLVFSFDPNCNPLYLNRGDRTFEDDSAPAAGVTADGSWAVIFLDVDQDGYEDLFVGTSTNGPSENFLYVNNGDGTFRDESATSGVDIPGNSRGGASADYDNDGDRDLAWVDRAGAADKGGGLRLFRNDTPNPGNWLQVRLTGVASNRSAIGSRLTARIGKVNLLRQVVGGSGAHGQDSLTAHFGLGAAAVVDELTIEWPGGAINAFRDVAASQILEINEQVEDHLALDADPDLVGWGDTLTFTTTGGSPGELMLLALTEVDGIPQFAPLDIATFDADGRRVWSLVVPPCYDEQLRIGFQSFGIESWSARPGFTELVVVDFR